MSTHSESDASLDRARDEAIPLLTADDRPIGTLTAVGVVAGADEVVVHLHLDDHGPVTVALPRAELREIV